MAEYKLSTKGSEFTRIEYDETEYDIVKLDTGEYIFSKNELVLKYPTSLTIEKSSSTYTINPVSFSSATRYINNKEALLIEDIPNKFGSTYSSVVDTYINSKGDIATSFKRVVDTSINCDYYGKSLLPTNKKRNIEAYVYFKQDLIHSVNYKRFVNPSDGKSPYYFNYGDQKKLYLIGYSDATSHPEYTFYSFYYEENGNSEYVQEMVFSVSMNAYDPNKSYGVYLTFYVSGFNTDHSDENYTIKVNSNGFVDKPLIKNKKYTVYNTGRGNSPIEFKFTADFKAYQNASLYIKVLPILVLPI